MGICKHPYVSRAWIGYSGFCHCYECGNIVEDERNIVEDERVEDEGEGFEELSNWHNEVFENEPEYLVDTEHGKIDTYEAKNYVHGCRICGTFNGEHGFSFDKRVL